MKKVGLILLLGLAGCVGDVPVTLAFTDASPSDTGAEQDGTSALDALSDVEGLGDGGAADVGSDVCVAGQLPDYSACIGTSYGVCFEWGKGFYCGSSSSPCSIGPNDTEASCRASCDAGDPCMVLNPVVVQTGCPAVLSPSVLAPSGILCNSQGAKYGTNPTQICQKDTDCLNLHTCRPVTVSKDGTVLNFGLCL